LKLFRGRAAQVEAGAPKPLSDAERQRLERMLSKDSDDRTGGQ